MTRKILGCALIALVAVVMVASLASADNTPQVKDRKSAWQKIVEYPANVTMESAKAVGDTAKKGTDVVVKEAKTMGQVATGQTDKAKELVTEPVKGTADTVATAVSETATAPVKAAQDY